MPSAHRHLFLRRLSFPDVDYTTTSLFVPPTKGVGHHHVQDQWKGPTIHLEQQKQRLYGLDTHKHYHVTNYNGVQGHTLHHMRCCWPNDIIIARFMRRLFTTKYANLYSTKLSLSHGEDLPRMLFTEICNRECTGLRIGALTSSNKQHSKTKH